ncbi:MAG: response regulator transcription factor [Dehalococcoidales bacterium]|nr:response regulator transcription factor [Dehalococcoidales bacterium]
MNNNSDLNGMKLRIVIAHPYPLMRYALRILIGKQADMELVAEATESEEVIEIIRVINTAIVLIDISLLGLNVLEKVKQLTESYPLVRVVVMIDDSNYEIIENIGISGASGYIIKNEYPAQIIHTIRSLFMANMVKFGEDLINNLRKDPTIQEIEDIDLLKLNKLNKRELEIIRLLVSGMTNKKIAEELGLSIRTIKAYLSTIFIKLGVSSRTEAISTVFMKKILNSTN